MSTIDDLTKGDDITNTTPVPETSGVKVKIERQEDVPEVRTRPIDPSHDVDEPYDKIQDRRIANRIQMGPPSAYEACDGIKLTFKCKSCNHTGPSTTFGICDSCMVRYGET